MSARVDIATVMSICKVSERTVRRWTADGRLTVEHRWDHRCSRTTAWYDVDEVLQWIDARNPASLFIRAGIPRDGWPQEVLDAYAATRREGVA